MNPTTTFNLAIALVDNRISDAREILRSLPLEESADLPVLQDRLSLSVDRVSTANAIQELTDILLASMRLSGSPETMNGVKAVEDIVEARLVQLRESRGIAE